MKPPFWKYWLSFLTEQHIETLDSEYNTSLHLFLSKGRYQLCTPNAIYSYADKYDNFMLCFRQMNLDYPPIQNVLLLGFGLGSIPYMIEKIFHKKWEYTGVEIDPEIIHLASKYVLDDLKSEIALYEADASIFIQQNTIKYDLICIDIFIDDKIPPYFLTTEFLLEIKESLANDGTVLFNHLAYSEIDISDAKNYFDDCFKLIFPEGSMVKVSQNYIMVSDKSRRFKSV